MAKPRKLWKVVIGDDEGPQLLDRPESKAKAYDIYVADAARARVYDWAEVWVDERDGHGWRLYERINLADYGTNPKD